MKPPCLCASVARDQRLSLAKAKISTSPSTRRLGETTRTVTSRPASRWLRDEATPKPEAEFETEPGPPASA